ncbi:kinase-like domain-containing protein [Paraphoma chrysanthemicola]|uniref:Kinase-like domain-containing protein n=1 Tax=Paraphoma chrysanthemicola TaxID=798071 RepID=A0A8K0R383_9PLEO|nr:kinase-like domain-containing protein [Paraphoma chrysanthemicola]
MPEDDESSGDAELNEPNKETDNVSDDDGDDDDDDDDDDDEVGHCNFATIGAITDTQFCTVVDLYCKTIGTNDQTRVINRTHGTYNYVASVDVSNEHGRAQYVVRVPGHGTKDHWQEEDAYTLEREVDMLKILSSRTSVPVSKVLAYSTSHDNALGFPFILMTRLPGKDAYSIWFDQAYQGNIEAACTADVPSIATERKRTTFLRSLAKVMTEIQSISFPGIGLPKYDEQEDETFTVHHNDLDLQNILVDTEGNVTGIIDWDNSYVSPRCTGAAAVPMFLRGDWFPYYANSLDNSPHMIFNYHHYREVYAAAMVEAGNITDAKYTMKSALYQAALAAITEGGDATDLISRILNEIPNCRVNVKDFKFAIARGWPAAQVILSRYLPEIFEPVLPRHGFLADAENDLEIREWMIGFDDFTMEEIESAPHNTSESVEAGTAGW